MEDLDALLADLENSAFPLARCPVLLTSDPPAACDPAPDPAPPRPPPPAYTPQQTVSAAMKSSGDSLYSSVCKKSPAFCSSSLMGGGLTELDHLLQELNATQFNITDEILAEFPPTDKEKLFRSSSSLVKPSATSATLELDKLMASLSDFKVQSSSAAPRSSVTSSAQQPAAPPPVPPPEASLDSMLGHLQSDLSRQGVVTSPKGHCSACQKPIVGQVVTALGRVWHPEHFVCSQCQCELGNSNFFEKDGRPYCEADYLRLYSPHCAQCQQPILHKMVTALEKTWHPECFSCVKCGAAFGDEGFHERDGQQHCQQCFLSLFASRCHACALPILQDYISALNTLWHTQCFVCRECLSPFVSGSFFEHEGQPLCEWHYHQSRGSVCQACDQPILGRCVTAMGAKFHPQHLVCHFCLKPLSKGCFKEQENKPYCHPCFSKLLG